MLATVHAAGVPVFGAKGIKCILSGPEFGITQGLFAVAPFVACHCPTYMVWHVESSFSVLIHRNPPLNSLAKYFTFV